MILIANRNPHEPGSLPACPFRTLTGWLCPGCGSTRMMHHLLHGELSIAASYNPVAFLCLPLIFGGMIHLALIAYRGIGMRTPRVRGWMPLFSLIVLLGWGVGRNLVHTPAAL